VEKGRQGDNDELTGVVVAVAAAARAAAVADAANMFWCSCCVIVGVTA
jgi:hypothetical protein